MNELASRALFSAETDQILRFATMRGWTVFTLEYPTIDIGFRGEGHPVLRLRLTTDNWNDQPPAIALLDLAGNILGPNTTPRHPGGVFNQSAHRYTGHPFVCMAGSREYHTHESHVMDSWENYKNSGRHNLAGLLTQLWNAWLKCHL